MNLFCERSRYAPLRLSAPPNPSKRHRIEAKANQVYYWVRRPITLVFVGVSKQMMQPTTLADFPYGTITVCEGAPPSHRGRTNRNAPSRTRTSRRWSSSCYFRSSDSSSNRANVETAKSQCAISAREPRPGGFRDGASEVRIPPAKTRAWLAGCLRARARAGAR